MNQLLVCLSYDTDTKVLESLSEAIAASDSQQIEMHVSSIGSRYQVVTLILSGTWNQLTRFKTRLSVIEKDYSIASIIKEITPAAYEANMLPYEVYVTMPADPKALHRAICFFLTPPLSLHTLSIKTYEAPVTKTRMLEVIFLLITTSSKPINDYRESTLQFCDENNFEVVFEPKRL